MESVLARVNEAEAVSSKSLIVLLLGPPGAGKGTHAGPLGETLGLPHISTGDLFRTHIHQKTALGLAAKGYINQGNLVPDDLVLEMLFDRLKESDCTAGCILDGFPRTLSQAKSLDERLKDTSFVLALNFYVPDPVLIERIAGRLVCRDCKKPHHQIFDPPCKSGCCDQCSGALYTRDDDQEAIVLKRLAVYREETMPLIGYYATQQGVLKEINGQNSKERVFRDLLEIVSQRTTT